MAIKVVLEGDFEEMRKVLSRMFEPAAEAKMHADRASESAMRADGAALEAKEAVDLIIKLGSKEK